MRSAWHGDYWSGYHEPDPYPSSIVRSVLIDDPALGELEFEVEFFLEWDGPDPSVGIFGTACNVYDAVLAQPVLICYQGIFEKGDNVEKVLPEDYLDQIEDLLGD